MSECCSHTLKLSFTWPVARTHTHPGLPRAIQQRNNLPLHTERVCWRVSHKMKQGCVIKLMAVVVMKIAKPIYASQMLQLLPLKGGPWVFTTNSNKLRNVWLGETESGWVAIYDQKIVIHSIALEPIQQNAHFGLLTSSLYQLFNICWPRHNTAWQTGVIPSVHHTTEPCKHCQYCSHSMLALHYKFIWSISWEIQAHISCLQQTIGYLSNVVFILQSHIILWSSLKAIANWCLQTLWIWASWCMFESGPCGDV